MSLRRLLLVVLAIVAASAVAAVLASRPPAANAGAGTYRVDAVFDTAKGVIPGQVVKIAGARVGTIKAVGLTGDDYKARIEMEVDGRFAPFRRDARCSIQPEGLISERFVQCEPGTPGAPQLTARAGHVATVPVDRTSVPVGLTDLFNVLTVPAKQRLRILLSSLGAGVAGRGGDLNAILLRASPVLRETRRVLRTLAEQRRALRSAVVSTDRAVGALARHRAGVRDFVDHAARAGARAATRRQDLTEAVRRLPRLLDVARPALVELGVTSRAVRPVLADLGAAARPLDRALTELPPFTRAARPALLRTSAASRAGLVATRRSAPVVALLRRFAAAARPTGESLSRTLVSLRDGGTLDGLLQFLYNAGATLALYDDTSHIGATRLTSNACVVGLPNAADPLLCPSDQAQLPSPSPGGGTARQRGRTSRPPAVRAPAPAAAAPGAPPGSAFKLPGLPAIPLPAPAGDAGGGRSDGDAVRDVLEFLLG